MEFQVRSKITDKLMGIDNPSIDTMEKAQAFVDDINAVDFLGNPLYTEEEKNQLKRHSNSLTQFIHLEGGIDTTKTKCHASNKIIGVHLLSGEITPCITVDGPVIGNVHKDKLDLQSDPIRCPNAGVNCVCEIHYEQDIVIGAEDSKSFCRRKEGFVESIKEQNPLKNMQAKGIKFYVNPKSGMAKKITDEQQLIFSNEHVKSSFRKNILGKTDS